jgi:hypothetical protein
MGMRLGRIILVVALAMSALTVCPQGRCPLFRKAEGGCCTKGDGLKAPSCCSGSAAHATAWLLAVGGQDASPVPPLAPALTVVSVDLATAAPAVLDRTADSARGLGPPGPLIDQHTSLLL